MMDKDKIYINIVNQLKHFSKCQFVKVACIAVNDAGRIKATGVNGTPSGMINCNDKYFANREEHSHWTNDYEIHAEMNMIEDLARSDPCPSHLTIYTNISPCKNCLKHLIGLTKSHGANKVIIDRIVYDNKYDKLSNEDIQMMKEYCNLANIKLERVKR